jgi:hypothetical protein
MACEKDWIDISTALLTPTIAIFGALIAYRQWRISQQKFRHDLYDRRFAVYTALLDLCGALLREGKFDNPSYSAWLKASNQGHFLFDEELNRYFSEVTEKVQAYRKIEREMQKQKVKDDEARWEELSNKDIELNSWFENQFNVAREKFSRFLTLDV